MPLQPLSVVHCRLHTPKQQDIMLFRAAGSRGSNQICTMTIQEKTDLHDQELSNPEMIEVLV